MACSCRTIANAASTGSTFRATALSRSLSHCGRLLPSISAVTGRPISDAKPISRSFCWCTERAHTGWHTLELGLRSQSNESYTRVKTLTFDSFRTATELAPCRGQAAEGVTTTQPRLWLKALKRPPKRRVVIHAFHFSQCLPHRVPTLSTTPPAYRNLRFGDCVRPWPGPLQSSCAAQVS